MMLMLEVTPKMQNVAINTHEQMYKYDGTSGVT